MAKSKSPVRALNQTGHVGDDEASVVTQTYHAKIRRERRKRVVGNLGPRRRDARDERRLARVGKPDEADVGQELQLQAQELVLARLARLDFARRAIGRCREPRVAHPAAAALGNQHALAFARQVGQELWFRVFVGGLLVDQRADWHRQLEIGAAVSGAVRTLTVVAALGGEFGMKPVADQGVGVRAGDDVHRTAVPAVAAARPPAGHAFLAAEREASASSAAGRHLDVYFVNKHRI